MRRLASLLACCLLALPLGCGDDDGGQNQNLNQTDAAIVDAAVDAAADASVLPDAGPACADVSGLYAVTGSCSSPAASLPPLICVKQEADCSATMSHTSLVYDGTVDGTGYSFTVLEPIEQHCSGSLVDDTASLDCQIPDFNVTCTGSGVDLGIPNTTALCCDVAVAEDCPALSRCTLTLPGAEYGLVAACTEPVGDPLAAEGAACVRQDNAVPGLDDCDPGLYCTSNGTPSADDRRCRQLCSADLPCDGGQACANASAVPPTGFCLDTCDLFDPATCEDGGACILMATLELDPATFQLRRGPFCHRTGTLALGDPCQYSNDCAAGLTCLSSVCEQLCDTAHPCAVGTCATFPTPLVTGLDLGYCN